MYLSGVSKAATVKFSAVYEHRGVEAGTAEYKVIVPKPSSMEWLADEEFASLTVVVCKDGEITSTVSNWHGPHACMGWYLGMVHCMASHGCITDIMPSLCPLQTVKDLLLVEPGTTWAQVMNRGYSAFYRLLVRVCKYAQMHALCWNDYIDYTCAPAVVL
jgi:hypothetical protein